MSNRNERRVVRRQMKVALPDGIESKVMTYLIGEMAAEGAGVLHRLDQDVGGPHKPGHAIDRAMDAALAMERAALAADPVTYAHAAVEVLFLVRDIAISQGKIKVSAAPAEGSGAQTN
jgi:hypothetical protein